MTESSGSGRCRSRSPFFSYTYVLVCGHYLEADLLFPRDVLYSCNLKRPEMERCTIITPSSLSLVGQIQGPGNQPLVWGRDGSRDRAALALRTRLEFTAAFLPFSLSSSYSELLVPCPHEFSTLSAQTPGSLTALAHIASNLGNRRQRVLFWMRENKPRDPKWGQPLSDRLERVWGGLFL